MHCVFCCSRAGLWEREKEREKGLLDRFPLLLLPSSNVLTFFAASLSSPPLVPPGLCCKRTCLVRRLCPQYFGVFCSVFPRLDIVLTWKKKKRWMHELVEKTSFDVLSGVFLTFLWWYIFHQNQLIHLIFDFYTQYIKRNDNQACHILSYSRSM